jgi:FkbM family methyltransferase
LSIADATINMKACRDTRSQLLDRGAMFKATIIRAARFAARSYIRFVPWIFGKACVRTFYGKYIGWRPYVATAKTRFGARMVLVLPDVISEEIYLTGQWEPAITRYIRSALKPGDTFIDIGANIGYYSLLASGIVGPRGRVMAIEASAAIYASMVRNLTINRRQNVKAINAAASDRPGELPVFLGKAENLGHTTTLESLATKEGLRLEARVRADTIEQLVGGKTLYGARIVKIDVEGAELSVLSPLFDSLTRFPDHTDWLIELGAKFTEHGESQVDRIYQAFVAAGYCAYEIRHSDHSGFTAPLRRLQQAPRSPLCDVLMTRAALNETELA